MSNTAESAIARLWRDRVQRREQERNEAQTRACAAEERLAALTAERPSGLPARTPWFGLRTTGWRSRSRA